MHATFTGICSLLDDTAARVRQAIPGPTTLKESVNWQFPLITGAELANMATSLSMRVKDANIEDIDEAMQPKVAEILGRLPLLWPDIIPNMPSNPPAVYAYTETISLIEKVLNPAIGFIQVDNPNLFPSKTVSRLKALNRSMESLEVDHQGLVSKIAQIDKAYNAADALPATLQDLEDAKAVLQSALGKVEKILEDSTKAQGKIEAHETTSGITLGLIDLNAAKADALIEKCEDAYQVTTTKGLAGAFDQRAFRLNVSIILWVCGLLVALSFGGYLGAKRIEALTNLLQGSHVDTGIALLQSALSIMVVAGPLWFAWLATKQIGQRFRLAEDYAFKASVAKAYEGYRKQAEDLDEQFSVRLFSSALSRLEEAPLRLIEKDSYGSPYHELLNSTAFNNAMSTLPWFREQIADMAKAGIAAVSASSSGRIKVEPVPAPVPEKSLPPA